MAKVYVFLAAGFEEVEALTQVDLLRRAGIEVETVSVADSLMVTSSHKVTVAADKMLAEVVDGELADMIIMPGGIPGVPNLRSSKMLEQLILKYYEADKYLAAICAGPSVYGQMGLLKGKKAICYPGFEDQLTDAIITVETVVRDGNFITSRGMGTAVPFGLALIEILADKETADQVAKKIVYQG